MLQLRRTTLAEKWETELKRPTKAVLPQIIGCFWEQATHTLQEEISKQLEQYRVCIIINVFPDDICHRLNVGRTILQKFVFGSDISNLLGEQVIGNLQQHKLH